MSTVDTGSTSRRALSWVVMLLGVALIGAAVLVLLTMNGDEAAVPPADPAPESPVDEQPDEPDPVDQTPIGVTYEILLTRDPFQPVRPPNEDEDEADDEDADNEVSGDEDDNGANGEEDDEANGEESPATTPATLSLVVYEVGDDSAVIQVGDLVLDVDVGDRFANRYTLTAIVDGCARIRDDITGQQRTICPTQESFK